MWATVARDRSRVGQRGSQSRGAEGTSGTGGGLFFRLFLLAATKEIDPGSGGRSPRNSRHNPAVGGTFRRLLRVARNDRTKPGSE